MNKLHELRSEIKLLEPTLSGICLSVTSSGCIYIDGEVDSSDLKKLVAVLEKYEDPASIKPQPINTHSTMNGFTRQETLAITKIAAGVLSHLDKLDIIRPNRVDSLKRPSVIYLVEQLIELKAASILRDRLPFRDTIRVIEALRSG